MHYKIYIGNNVTPMESPRCENVINILINTNKQEILLKWKVNSNTSFYFFVINIPFSVMGPKIRVKQYANNQNIPITVIPFSR